MTKSNSTSSVFAIFDKYSGEFLTDQLEQQPKWVESK